MSCRQRRPPECMTSSRERHSIVPAEFHRPPRQAGALGDLPGPIGHPAIHLAPEMTPRRHAVGRCEIRIKLGSLVEQGKRRLDRFARSAVQLRGATQVIVVGVQAFRRLSLGALDFRPLELEGQHGNGGFVRPFRRFAGGVFHAPVLSDLDLADEAETLAGDRPDQAPLLAGVANGFANRVDVTGDRRLRDNSAAPYRSEQVVLADDAVAVPDEMQQQIEDLRPDRHDFRAMRKLPARTSPQRAGNLHAHRRQRLRSKEAERSHEDCRDRRQRPHRNETGEGPRRARP